MTIRCFWQQWTIGLHAKHKAQWKYTG